ncbi:hypothetical protein Mth01_52980 [Sphaerimonospora thailandensis]|uniref:Uncharacterized protein n=1 Tax=Sphaerimonospora thailandensis TaxID=795644 RepID=A0A8J3RE27_9ACTN|nr:hypothetical protein Mth01_52980 [Sphaerimonospora thailandensis]
MRRCEFGLGSRRWLVRAAVLVTLGIFPGLTQLESLPAAADPQPVNLDLPMQASGSATGLPHLVSSDATQARLPGLVKAGGKEKRPKGALPIEDRFDDGHEVISPAPVSRIKGRLKKPTPLPLGITFDPGGRWSRER